MPQAEFYGAQPPIEVLRQGIDLGLWYNRKTNAAMHLIDVQVRLVKNLTLTIFSAILNNF